MRFDMLDKMLSAMKDYHLPICVFMFLVGTVLSWFHHLDASFVAYTATILSAITGHAFSPAQKDHDNDTPSSSTPAGGS